MDARLPHISPAVELEVDFYLDRHVGLKRPNNEDFVTGFKPDKEDDLRLSGCLFIVADGVGGAEQGELASEHASRKVLSEYYAHPEIEPGPRFYRVLQQAGNEIFDYTRQSLNVTRMATTMVAVSVRSDVLTVANVGDSRAYLIRDGKAEQLTDDHSLVMDMVRKGVMTEEEANVSPVKNRLTRSIGGERDVKVDVFELNLKPGDVILLCSDGLHRYFDDKQQIVELAKEPSPKDAVDAAIELALNGGGADNISALFAYISAKQPGVPAPLPAQQASIRPPTPLPARPAPGGASPSQPAPRPAPADALLAPTRPPMLDDAPTIELPPRPRQEARPYNLPKYLALAVGVALVFCLFALLGSLLGNRVIDSLKTGARQPRDLQVAIQGVDLAEPAPGVPPVPPAQLPAAWKLIYLPYAEHNEVFYQASAAYPLPEAGATLQAMARYVCIVEVISGRNLGYILIDFGLTEDPDGDYFTCTYDEGDGRCTGMQVIANHDKLFPGEWLVVPVSSRDACERGSGVWVTAES